MSNLSRP